VKLKTFVMMIVFAGSTLLPSAKADEWNKETTVAFSSPVQVPGQVLPAGQSSSNSPTANRIATSCRFSRKTSVR
jgi:hypothetical protein